jgi:acetyl esterase/lipase
VATIGDPIRLYDGPALGSEDWSEPEQEYFSDIFQTDVVTNVAVPTLTPVVASEPNGTAVVVAPGGGYHALSIESEGFGAARWLAERGVSAFVLKYRLVQCRDEAVGAMLQKAVADEAAAEAEMRHVADLAADDGRCAVQLVRERAPEFRVDPGRVGLMGFSAGGHLTMQVVLDSDDTARPDFSAPIYASMNHVAMTGPPEGAGPAFIVAATDDQLGLAADSVEIYQAWRAAGLSAELHLYSHGGHGFGVRTQGLPTDSWIERFGDWLDVHGYMGGEAVPVAQGLGLAGTT